MRTPPKFLLCYEGFDNGTTVMQKSCFTLKTDLQCRPLSELNVASSHRRVQSKKHYCMPVSSKCIISKINHYGMPVGLHYVAIINEKLP